MAETDPPAGLRPDECREPTLEDLVKICRALNAAGARYLVVGGFAIRAAGFIRSTIDVDLVIETGAENETRVIQALQVLPDRAAQALVPGEVARYGVVRVGDEIMVDLMKSACAVDYHEAMQDMVYREIDGVRIPFASPKTLWRMKQTVREKDIPDRLFLRRLLKEQGMEVEPPPPAAKPTGLKAWLRRMFGGP
jgi:hypothetical protein